MNDQQQRERVIEKFGKFLDSKRLRRTAERMAILEMALSMPRHYTLEEIRSKMESSGFTVSRATVYNTFALLIDCGLVRCHRFDGKAPAYETVNTLHNHHHLVCTRCGKVREVSDIELQRSINARRDDRFHPEYFTLTIYGICSRCARKSRQKK